MRIPQQANVLPIQQQSRVPFGYRCPIVGDSAGVPEIIASYNDFQYADPQKDEPYGDSVGIPEIIASFNDFQYADLSPEEITPRAQETLRVPFVHYGITA